MSLVTSNLRGVERFGELAIQPEIARAVPEGRTRNAGSDMVAADTACFVLAVDLVDEEILGDDHVAFRTDHLGDIGDATRTVAQALGLHDDIDRADDHLADGL